MQRPARAAAASANPAFLHQTRHQLNITNTRTHARTHTHTHQFNSHLSRTTPVSRYQKGKTNLDFTKQETASGSGISWAICTLLQCQHPTFQFFTGQMPFLLPTQQCQSTEGLSKYDSNEWLSYLVSVPQMAFTIYGAKNMFM